jgi:hypothetical protein
MERLPKFATQRLQATAKAEPHPDLNLLTAFVERSLGKSERSVVMGHLAHCAECREVVALSVPETLATVPGRAAPAASGWLSWPVLRWGALAACVVVVGAAVTLRYRENRESFVPTRQIQQTQQAQAQQIQAKTATPSANPAPATEIASAKPLVQREAKPEATGSLQASKPEPATDSAASSEIAEMVPPRAKEAQAEPSSSILPPSSAENRFAASPSASFAKARIAANAVPLPANVVPRWTLSADGILQRSFDSGRTWETIPISSKTTFRALAANGMDIWVGGSSGTLYHSSDAGQHWTQVRPVSNGEFLTADIIGVEFTDALRGRVTTSDEQTWTTEDAGQSWQRR